MRDERHVPGDAHDRSWRRHHGGVDAAERAEARTQVADGAEIGPPFGGIRCIGNEERGLAQCLFHGAHQPIENALPAHQLQSFGLSTEPRGAAARQNCSPNPAELRSIPSPLPPLEHHVEADS